MENRKMLMEQKRRRRRFTTLFRLAPSTKPSIHNLVTYF
jgi:hypothetical protein